jgi:hypothetical protein
MENQKINQQFRDDEIANIRRWDKERNEYITNPFPKIAGRLRLAHEANETLSIETEIIRYDEKVAVVIATSKTTKGSFKGIGMASIERDQKIAPAILELAETRAIGRSLRFAGYGVEYCSAEEVSHIENGNGNGGNGHNARQNQNDNLPPKGNRNGDNLPDKGHRNGGSGSNNPGNGGNGSGGSNGNGNNRPSGSDGNGNGRLSAKQFQYLQKLNSEIGRATAELDKQCLAKFGTVAQFLSKGDASQMIEHLLSK